ncbi:leucine-rich repeat receptor-like serine/threonine-protein kinase BAM1 [Punica granatum]|uniref:non-specific serine/threonine protein kinase n=2 Tax=Punica granatum TaxID=22663 RepID=A0A2I0L2Q8_PUNGR|nr:leucine-rich repeat receptor-like serine/threonine-protein kinase BAM1 [Punica granatum]PKI74880.1 hypothetical protein CRG98_004652 [Punica granatum]
MILIVLTVLILQGTLQCGSSSLLGDFDALIELKQGFQSAESVLSTWNSSVPGSVCSWTEVRCSRGRVVSVNLADLNLQGSISSAAISRLDHLVELTLSGNNFGGPISVSNLSSLRWLNISNNQFSGSLEWNFSSIRKLKVLDAYNNNFTGPLPLGIASLERLEFLSLGGNYLTGKIPESYGNFSGLKYLSLAGNELHGKIPAELGNLTALREIYLNYYNVFEDGIPRELGNLVNLVHADLSSCGLDGEIPGELGNLRSLNTLYLHINVLSGPIPRELGNLTRLVNLDLSINSLTGEIPFEFANLKRLELLNLFMNRLHGSIPEFVSELPRLERLELWRNNFTGMIPRNLGQNGRLQRLDLSSNKLTGTVPPSLCLSNRLEVLILLENFLFGPIPESLGRCLSLVRVRLGHNYLNGSIPEGFIYLPELNLIELHNNFLSGTLSENYRNISQNPGKLNKLNLSNNLLSGPLPISLSNFSNLQILLLNGNRFSGPIPDSLVTLRAIVKLDLSQNLLSGQIPKEIGKCNHLTYLDMSQNNLTGPIPPEISDVQVLNYFNVSRNHLNQAIPVKISMTKSLTNADFSFNNFSGEIPESGQFLALNASSFVGNPHLCGSILRNPCNVAVLLTDKTENKGPSNLRLIIALAILVFSLAFAAAAIFKAKSFKRKGGNSWKMTSFQKLDFGVLDVLDCLKDGNEIGRGGAGTVYHGKMPNGVEIAVKKLPGLGAKNHHDRGFRAEIQTLGNIRHRNIVRLLAFCSNKDANLLVYEYMKNGSLGEALHGKKEGMFLGWDLRYKIAVEAAKGLCYLHHDCSPLIVHRDVKSNNILLNSSFEAHIADFGLAKFLSGGSGRSECMSAVAGSYGYIAPEYAYTLQVDEKSDVYSFGVVLLELLMGRRPVGDFGEGVDIVQWTKMATGGHREEVTRIMDSRLTLVPKDEAMHMFFIAELCIQENSVERPTMREVVQMLSEFPHHLSNDESSSHSARCSTNTS